MTSALRGRSHQILHSVSTALAARKNVEGDARASCVLVAPPEEIIIRCGLAGTAFTCIFAIVFTFGNATHSKRMRQHVHRARAASDFHDCTMPVHVGAAHPTYTGRHLVLVVA
ncbi:hypothetical protein F442_01126 [Phytophthora nicotianae P10297]|uniref:Uncharacterized protein n=1 Tax=Phytophthora nicotianae P10297 TaxID=1317064 RepID=W3A358_PHYNI|nr:hypothetical protein F442_01126 [Phytophthora nicotianae P10297]